MGPLIIGKYSYDKSHEIKEKCKVPQLQVSLNLIKTGIRGEIKHEKEKSKL